MNERRIQDVTQEHIEWIKSQLIKSNNFMHAKGRIVYIDSLENMETKYVKIPERNDLNYRKAWADVYNMAIEYLEISLQKAGNYDNCDIILPAFNCENAQYARSLEMMLEEYKKYKSTKNENKKNNEIKVRERTIPLKPISDVHINQVYSKEILKSEQPLLNYNEENNKSNENNLSSNITDESNNIVLQKISDGELLDEHDFTMLKENNNLIILPCIDVDKIKEEKLFLNNAQKCEDEGIKIGAFLYGHANDEIEASLELKRIVKLLESQKSNFSGFVIYEINDDYVVKNKESEMKLLSFINAYTIIAEGLANASFMPMISMNVESKKILDDIYRRYNQETKYEICYIVLAREINEIEKGKSTILVDPQYDYDMITICDTPFKNNEALKKINKNCEIVKVA